MSNIFPKWVDRLREVIAVAVIGGFATTVFVVNTYLSDDNLTVGYMPQQPVPFSHRLHAGKNAGAGELGLDCRYCHTNVERSAHATVPATDVCIGCHAKVKTESPKLALLRERYQTKIDIPVSIDAAGAASRETKKIDNPDYLKPIPWVKVHKLADYVYFRHDVHVKQGVSCVECHGRVDQMDEVRQTKSLSMRFCLDCHRDTTKLHGTRPADKVTDLGWNFASDADKQAFIKNHASKLNPPKDKDCSSCHR